VFGNKQLSLSCCFHKVSVECSKQHSSVQLATWLMALHSRQPGYQGKV
jgi:hypothetical protein